MNALQVIWSPPQLARNDVVPSPNFHEFADVRKREDSAGVGASRANRDDLEVSATRENCARKSTKRKWEYCHWPIKMAILSHGVQAATRYDTRRNSIYAVNRRVPKYSTARRAARIIPCGVTEEPQGCTTDSWHCSRSAGSAADAQPNVTGLR
jgi:hypothetical protein